jgi:hypothetical protein
VRPIRNVALWLVAVAITLVSAWWQRTSGSSYPVETEVRLGGTTDLRGVEAATSISRSALAPARERLEAMVNGFPGGECFPAGRGAPGRDWVLTPRLGGFGSRRWW